VTTPIDEEDVDVPLRLQPVVARPQGWRGRSSSFVAIGLVAFVVVAVVLGTAFDDSVPAAPPPVAVASPSASPATPRPSARPTVSREPLATPLPERLVLGGQIPKERRLVFANGFAMLDLATGGLTQLARSFEWPSLPLPGDQLVCLCVIRDAAASGGDGGPILRFGRFDQTGAPIVEQDLLSLEGVAEAPGMAEGFNVAIALDPDRTSLYALVAQRRPPVWTVDLYVVDIETADLLTSVEIGQFPVDIDAPDASASPSPSGGPRPGGGPADGVYAWASSVAVSPGGRSVLVSVDWSEVRSDNWTNQLVEWMVEFEPGTPPAARPISPEADLEPGDWCMSQPTFVDAELLVQVCGQFDEGVANGLQVRRVTADGASLGAVRIPLVPFNGGYPVSIATDRARRAVFLWNPQEHKLVRVDVDGGRITEAAVPASMLPGAETPVGQGYIGGDPGLVLSPDGRRLYAIGVGAVTGSQVGVPSGIWVFDTDSMQLIDHWQPRAFLSSLTISSDGRFVYAAGAAGYDVNGRENRWPASVTVYDAATGEIQVVYGSVARDAWLSFIALP
jgi:hypothetical protein